MVSKVTPPLKNKNLVQLNYATQLPIVIPTNTRALHAGGAPTTDIYIHPPTFLRITKKSKYIILSYSF